MSNTATVRGILAGAMHAYRRHVEVSAGGPWENEARAARDAAANMFAAYLVATGEHANQVQAVRTIAAELKADDVTAEVFHLEEITTAINAGGELVGLEIHGDYEGPENDAIHLAATAAVAWLKQPGITFADMVADNFTETPDEILSWWNGWG